MTLDILAGPSSMLKKVLAAKESTESVVGLDGAHNNGIIVNQEGSVKLVNLFLSPIRVWCLVSVVFCSLHPIILDYSICYAGPGVLVMGEFRGFGVSVLDVVRSQKEQHTQDACLCGPSRFSDVTSTNRPITGYQAQLTHESKHHILIFPIRLSFLVLLLSCTTLSQAFLTHNQNLRKTCIIVLYYYQLVTPIYCAFIP